MAHYCHHAWVACRLTSAHQAVHREGAVQLRESRRKGFSERRRTCHVTQAQHGHGMVMTQHLEPWRAWRGRCKHAATVFHAALPPATPATPATGRTCHAPTQPRSRTQTNLQQVSPQIRWVVSLGRIPLHIVAHAVAAVVPPVVVHGLVGHQGSSRMGCSLLAFGPQRCMHAQHAQS